MDREHALADEVWTLIDKYFIDPTFHAQDWESTRNTLLTRPLPSRRATYAALRVALAQLGDRYTRIVSPAEMDALRKYDVSGVGLLLSADERGALVVASDPPARSSAGRAGVRRGDVVVAVDGVSLAGRAAFDVAQLMQGEDGSVMRVSVRAGGRDAQRGRVREVDLVRMYAQSGGAPVQYSLEMGGGGGRAVGYVRIRDFSSRTRGEVEAALRVLDGQGAQAYVLDLRGNPGGVFEGALEVAGLLEGRDAIVARVTSRVGQAGGDKEGEVFRSRLVGEERGEDGAMDAKVDTTVVGTDRGRRGSASDRRLQKKRYAGGAAVAPEAPLAVLVDGGSASASEVLAGSLQDNCRAAIVGQEHSFGKGLIQGVFGLSDGGGVVVTVGKYTTPAGHEIQGKGVAPTSGYANGMLDQAKRAVLKQGASSGIDFRAVEDSIRMCKERDEATQRSAIFPAERFGALL